MAVVGKLYKEGSTECEVITGITVGNGTVTVTHSLGGTPNVVQITQKSDDIIFVASVGASSLTLTGGDAAAACELVLKRIMPSASITETVS